MSVSPLTVTVEDGVAVLTLNRPEALNALSAALRGALVAALDEMDAREDVRTIILTGSGRAFTAGLDVKELESSATDVSENVADTDIGAAISRLRMPIIAAINGLAVTGGFEITLSCDIVLAAESAWFADTHVKIGLLPGWGLSQRLSRAVGVYRAKEISLTARRVTATEAAELGFVNRVVPDADLMGEAMGMARQIAAAQPRVATALKTLIDDGYGLSLDDALRLEAESSTRFNSEVVIGKD